MDEEQRDEGRSGIDEPRHALPAERRDDGDGEEEDRQPRPRQRARAGCSRRATVGSPRREPRAIGVAYGRILPSVFHRYSVRGLPAVSVKVSTLSGFQSPMLKVCDTMRAPGFSWRGQDRPELEVRRREQVERHDGGVAQVGRHRVLQPERHEVGDPGLLGVGVGLGDPLRIDVHADPAGAVDLGGGDRNPAVAAAEVDRRCRPCRRQPAEACGRRLPAASGRRAPAAARPAASGRRLAGATVGRGNATDVTATIARAPARP